MKLSDTVLRRIVQIIQEAMLTGIDCVDLLRQISLIEDESQKGYLTLTKEYELMVESHINKLLEEAEKLKNVKSS